MSEFSCSYHLKSESIDDCKKLIKRADLAGFLFPLKNGWVSFVVDEPDFQFSKKLIDANEGVLLNFINAEDHGWSFEIYNKNEKICKFECEYGEKEKYSYEKNTNDWIGLFDDKQSDLLDRILDEQKIISADDFAVGMGLHFYEWISYSYIFNDADSYKEDGIKITAIKKKRRDKKVEPVIPNMPVFEWRSSNLPTPMNRVAQSKQEKGVFPSRDIMFIGETIYSDQTFVNTGKDCNGIIVPIIGKSLEEESIEFEHLQLFKGHTFGNKPFAEAKFVKETFLDGRKGYIAKLDDIEIIHSIPSAPDDFGKASKTKSKTREYQEYTIRLLFRAVSRTDNFEVFMFIHSIENFYEGYLCEEFLKDRIVIGDSQ
jgi:hypothetical protein